MSTSDEPEYEYDPAYFSGQGAQRVECFDKDRRLHHDRAPAVKTLHDDGSREERYYRHGELHRDGGPALIAFDAGGRVTKQEYFRGGKLHRERDEGPAMIGYLPDGSLMLGWFENGMPADPPEACFKDPLGYADKHFPGATISIDYEGRHTAPTEQGREMMEQGVFFYNRVVVSVRRAHGGRPVAVKGPQSGGPNG
jgi:hypothetical protein